MCISEDATLIVVVLINNIPSHDAVARSVWCDRVGCNKGNKGNVFWTRKSATECLRHSRRHQFSMPTQVNRDRRGLRWH